MAAKKSARPGFLSVMALRRMIGMLGRFELSANFDRLTATHRRGMVEVIHELPMARLKVKGKDGYLHFTAGTESFTLPCAFSPERKALLASLSELSQRANAPGEWSDVPSELASLMSRPAPVAEP